MHCSIPHSSGHILDRAARHYLSLTNTAKTRILSVGCREDPPNLEGLDYVGWAAIGAQPFCTLNPSPRVSSSNRVRSTSVH